MKVGDVVIFEDEYNSDDKRRIGTVVGFDMYSRADREMMPGPAESLVEVMWSTGERGWILERRVRVISESR